MIVLVTRISCRLLFEKIDFEVHPSQVQEPDLFLRTSLMSLAAT
jgi:hypothetical protein